tara:strand:- start:675 stop:863 length:189 start_codon:yes stop_codon:yes gene_type:complete
MYYRIIGNKGQERFVKAKSKSEGGEVAERLRHVMKQGKIKRFEKVEFDKVTPEDISKDEIFA